MNIFTPFDPWQSKLCTCPPKYSLSPYTGCGHNCLYCYASSYILNFFNSRPKKNFIIRLKQEIKQLPQNSYITIASSSDPYLPLEKNLRLTRHTLKILKDYNVKIMLVTKSDFIISDIDILKEIKNVIISFTITTLNKTLAKKLEPKAPSPKRRLKAIEKLAKKFTVVCRFDPLIYPLNTQNIKDIIRELRNNGIRQIITSTYKAKPDNLKRMMSAFSKHKSLWQNLYLKKGEKKGRYIYLPKEIREKLILAVKEEASSFKLAFSSCREGLEKLNTHICDGSSFFK